MARRLPGLPEILREEKSMRETNTCLRSQHSQGVIGLLCPTGLPGGLLSISAPDRLGGSSRESQRRVRVERLVSHRDRQLSSGASRLSLAQTRHGDCLEGECRQGELAGEGQKEKLMEIKALSCTGGIIRSAEVMQIPAAKATPPLSLLKS